MSKAIFTRYHGPSSTRPARILASDSDGNKIVISCERIQETGSQHENAHRKAAETLAAKMQWEGQLIEGGHSKGRVFVFAPEPEQQGPLVLRVNRITGEVRPLAFAQAVNELSAGMPADKYPSRLDIAVALARAGNMYTASFAYTTAPLYVNKNEIHNATIGINRTRLIDTRPIDRSHK